MSTRALSASDCVVAVRFGITGNAEANLSIVDDTGMVLLRSQNTI